MRGQQNTSCIQGLQAAPSLPHKPFLFRTKNFLYRQIHEISKKLGKVKNEYKHQEAWPLDQPIATIIIPCYNYGNFIEQAIHSALEQTLRRLEVIIINDGSTDPHTLDVLSKITHENVRLIHQENQGLADTRNNGAKIARGKYICYLDADDHIDSNYLERTVSIMESDESIGCCYSWVQCFGEYESIWETMELDPFYLHQSNTAPSHSVIRKAAWEAIREFNGCGFLSKYNGYFEDWVFWIDMLQIGYRGAVIREPLIHYRVHSNSLGARSRTKFNEMLLVLHSDRKEFFNSSSYRRKIQKNLNKRSPIKNRYENYPW